MDISNKRLAGNLRISADELARIGTPPHVVTPILMAADRLEDKTPEPLTKLEQFTMAAMQGLLAGGMEGDGYVAEGAIIYAQAALAQLEEET